MLENCGCTVQLLYIVARKYYLILSVNRPLEDKSCGGVLFSFFSFLTFRFPFFRFPFISLNPLLYPSHGFYAIVTFAKCRKADVSFTARPEAYARRTYHVCFVKQLVEEFPRACSIRGFHPEVRSVDSSVDFQPSTFQSLFHDTGIVHIVLDGCLYLLFAFRSIDGFGRPLGDIGSAVELGALAAVP